MDAHGTGRMQGVAALLYLTASAADAADFRTLNIGEPCTSIPALEAGLRSVPVPWEKIEGGQVYAFRAKEFDREVMLSYFCVKGHLYTGNYYFPLESLQAAVKTLESVYSALAATQGTPFFDSSPWQFGRIPPEPRAMASDPRHYHIVWDTGVINTTMSIVPNLKSEAQGFRVFIVISRLRQ